VLSLPELDYGTVLEAVGQSLLPEAEEAWDEGTPALRRHRAHERNRAAVADKKTQVRAASDGRLVCEACGTNGDDPYGASADAAFECHHRVPLTEGPRTTVAADLALLCASCHRVLHAGQPLPSVEQFRARLGSQ